MQTTKTTTTTTATPAAPTAIEAAAALRATQENIESIEANAYNMLTHCNATADRRGWDDPWVQSYSANIGDLLQCVERLRATLPELRRAVALEVARETMRDSA